MDAQLKGFITVAKTKSFTRASELLNITQPAVTKQIKNLEGALNTKLFRRSGSRISLTEAGQILMRYADEMDRLYKQALQEIHELSGRVAGEVQFGATTLLAKYFFPKIIGEFSKSYPDTCLSMLVGNSEEIHQYLKSEIIEFGVLSEPLGSEDIISIPLYRDRLTVIVHPDHPWCRRDEINVEELFEEGFISREIGSGTRKVYTSCLAKISKPKSLKTVMVLGSTEAVKTAVMGGYGFSIVSNLACRLETSQGVLREIRVKDLQMKRDFFIVIKSKEIMSIAGRKLKEFMLKNKASLMT
jgi:DNA-binding transcriptional LysR family regulator